MNAIMPEWIVNILQRIKPFIPREFIGRVEVNIFKGGITNVNVVQSFKEKES